MPFKVKKAHKKAIKKTTCFSAYITYKSPLAASTAIMALSLPSSTAAGEKNSTPNLFKASYGTNKFCLYFIEGTPCRNKKCNFIHERVHFEDCFMKTNDVDNRTIFQSQISWASKCVADWIMVNRLFPKIEILDEKSSYFEKSRISIFENGLPDIDLVFNFIAKKMRKGEIEHTQSALESINSMELSLEMENKTNKKFDRNKRDIKQTQKINKFTSLDDEGVFQKKNTTSLGKIDISKTIYSTSLNLPSNSLNLIKTSNSNQEMKKKKKNPLKESTTIKKNQNDNNLEQEIQNLPYPQNQQMQQRDNPPYQIEEKNRILVCLSFTTNSPVLAYNEVIKGLNNSEMCMGVITNNCPHIDFNHKAGNLMLNLPDVSKTSNLSFYFNDKNDFSFENNYYFYNENYQGKFNSNATSFVRDLRGNGSKEYSWF